MNNLAFVYERLGESIKSELMYRECCELFVTQYGTANQQSLMAMKNLAHLFYKHEVSGSTPDSCLMMARSCL